MPSWLSFAHTFFPFFPSWSRDPNREYFPIYYVCRLMKMIIEVYFTVRVLLIEFKDYESYINYDSHLTNLEQTLFRSENENFHFRFRWEAFHWKIISTTNLTWKSFHWSQCRALLAYCGNSMTSNFFYRSEFSQANHDTEKTFVISLESNSETEKNYATISISGLKSINKFVWLRFNYARQMNSTATPQKKHKKILILIERIRFGM